MPTPIYEPTVTAKDILDHTYFMLNESGLSDFIDTDESISMLNYALRELYARTEKLQKNMSLTIATGNSVSLPTDFLALAERHNPKVYYVVPGQSPVPLSFIKYPEFVGLPTTATGTPSLFTIANTTSFVTGTLYIHPAASSACTIEGIYIPLPAVVTAPTDTLTIDAYFTIPIASLICWMYKYRDRDPNYGDHHYLAWENALRRYNSFFYNRLDQPTVSWKYMGQQRTGRR